MCSRTVTPTATRLPALAAELVRAGVDVIVLPATHLTLALQKAATTIPIVELSDALLARQLRQDCQL